MMWLHPRQVMFGSERLTHVQSVVVNRKAEGAVVEYGNDGPHVAFVDVPQQRVTIVLERVVTEDEAMLLRPSQSDTLTFETAPSLSDASVRQITATVVLTSVSYAASAKQGLVQRVEGVAVSTDGAVDPVVDQAIGG